VLDFLKGTKIFRHWAGVAGEYPGCDLGVKTPPSTKIFLNLLGFFEKKIIKKFKTPPQKISGYASAVWYQFWDRFALKSSTKLSLHPSYARIYFLCVF